MPPSPPPPPPPLPDDRAERHEWRRALLTFAPAIAVAFLLERVLRAVTDWPPRQALAASVVAGIAIAVVLERVVRRARTSGGGERGRS